MTLKTLTTPAVIAILVAGLAFSFRPVAALAHGGHGAHGTDATTAKMSAAAEATEGTPAPSEGQAPRSEGATSPWLPVAFTLSGVVVLGGLVVVLRRS